MDADKGKKTKSLNEIYLAVAVDKESLDVLIDYADEKFGDFQGVPGWLHLARHISDSLRQTADYLEEHANTETEQEAA